MVIFTAKRFKKAYICIFLHFTPHPALMVRPLKNNFFMASLMLCKLAHNFFFVSAANNGQFFKRISPSTNSPTPHLKTAIFAPFAKCQIYGNPYNHFCYLVEKIPYAF